MLSFPHLPAVPDAQRATRYVGVRYEDIAQDGALKVLGMPHAVNAVCFGELWQLSEFSHRTRSQGVLPILARLTMGGMGGAGGPISVRQAVEVDGRYWLAHTSNEEGAVDRILLTMAADLFGPASRTHDPQPANQGERLHVGRVVAEHVFTRPFAPPSQRKVAALDLPDGPLVPELRANVRPAASTLSLPEQVLWLEPDFMVDTVPLVFGLAHTDSNQHVNSLIYPQLFEDAALRRLYHLGRDTAPLLVDHIEIAFRKPCFSGERMWINLRSFERAGKLGAVGYLGPTDCPVERAHTLCRLTFR